MKKVKVLEEPRPLMDYDVERYDKLYKKYGELNKKYTDAVNECEALGKDNETLRKLVEAIEDTKNEQSKYIKVLKNRIETLDNRLIVNNTGDYDVELKGMVL